MEDKKVEGQSEVIKPTKSNKWLQKLKDESWEAELLVSAIAIFGTFQLFKVIDWSTNFFIETLPPDQYLIGYSIVFMGLLAVSVLVSMFVIHFFLRAYWIGLVGLNSVFPDYGLKDSAYSEIYTEKLVAILPKLKDSLQKIDELCSVIFSAAFTILLTYLYFALFASIYLYLFNLLSEYVHSYFLLIPAALFGIVYIIQMIIGIIANLKAFKQNRAIQTWYFKIVKLASILILGPLYKSVLQISMIFGTNFKKKKALIKLIVLFLFSGIFIAVYQMSKTNIPYLINQEFYFDETMSYAGYYKTENENINFLLAPEIASDMIQSNSLKLFIPVFSHEKKMREKICGNYTIDENKSKSEQRKERRIQSLNCYQKYNQVYLNGTKISPEYMKYSHPKTDQFGIVCYVNLTNAIEGKNIVEIKKDYGDDTITEWAIPFQYNIKH